MKGIGTLIRLQRHELTEKKKALAIIEQEAANIRAAMAEMESGLVREKLLASADLALAQTFPAFLQATIAARRAMEVALSDIARRIAAAEAEIADAFRGLKAYELAAEGAEQAEARKKARAEQKIMDEIGGRATPSAARHALLGQAR